MPNLSYQDNNYYARPPCAQQSVPYIIPNNTYNPQGYDLMYTNRNQYVQNNGTTFEHVDNNWLPDPRMVSEIEKGLKFSDKIESIEISSKDLSPASCCSNIDLLLPDFYKNLNKVDSQWYYNSKSYVEYPSCAQVSCEQEAGEKTVKYCSIQKPNYDYNTQPDLFASDVFPPQEILQFDPMPNLNHKTDEDSDIIVEESDEEIINYEERKFSCIVCNIIYSPMGSQFYLLTTESPLTMSTQKPLYNKLIELIGKLQDKNNYLCSQCLGLVNTIDHLQQKLESCRNELQTKFQKTNNIKLQSKTKCKHKFNCKLCKKVLSLESIYKTQIRRRKYINKFLCEFCGRRFSKFKQLKLHSKTHNSNVGMKKIRIEAFLCRICAKPFRTRSNLKEHENHCSGKLPYKCRNCNKKFATSTKLKSHMRLKHDKKFTSICSICNIGFIKLSDYKTHMVSHSTEKKFSCSECDKSYKTLSNLNFHMKFHAKQLPFICTICKKGFMRKEYLESHTNLHNGAKNFACSICEKKFVSQKNLDAHMKQHDGNIKKKSCNVCGKLIAKGLEDHLRTHTNLKEFECELCDLRFNTKSGLLKHKKRKHNT